MLEETPLCELSRGSIQFFITFRLRRKRGNKLIFLPNPLLLNSAQVMEMDEVEKVDSEFVLKLHDDLKQHEPIRVLGVEVFIKIIISSIIPPFNKQRVILSPKMVQ